MSPATCSLPAPPCRCCRAGGARPDREDRMNKYGLLLVLVLSTPLIAQPGQNANPGTLAITHVTVIDCTGREAQPDVTVLVADGRIAGLGEAKDVAVPRGA